MLYTWYVAGHVGKFRQAEFVFEDSHNGVNKYTVGCPDRQSR